MKWRDPKHTYVGPGGLDLDCRVEASSGVNHNLLTRLRALYHLRRAQGEDF